MEPEKLICQFRNIFDIPVTTIDGDSYEKLSDFVKDKKLYLIINIASNSKKSDDYFKQLAMMYKVFKK